MTHPTDALAVCDATLDDLSDRDAEYLRIADVLAICDALRLASLRVIELRSSSPQAREAILLRDAQHQLGRVLMRRH